MLPGWSVAPLGAFLLIAVWSSGRRLRQPRRLLARMVLIAYLTWLASEVFLPLPLDSPAAGSSASAAAVISHIRLMPFESVRELLTPGWDWLTSRILLGNVVVFVPVGLLLPLATARLTTWARVFGAALALSLTIELGQLALCLVVGSSYRVTEIDDVLLNVAGVLAGFLLSRSLPARRGLTDPASTARTVARCGGRC